MEERMYTEEEMQQKVREATHPHPHTMVTQPQPIKSPEAALTKHRSNTSMQVQRSYLTTPGLEDLTVQEDLLLGRWRLVQHSSTIDGQAGQWNNNLSEEIRNYLDLVVLKISPSRAYFDENRKLRCMSRNGTHSTSGRQCWGCPLAQWGEDGEPPPCSRGYTLICWDPTEEALCLIGALRTGVPPIRLYFSKLDRKKTPPFHFLTRFTAREEKGPKGKYMVINPEIIEELDQAKKDHYYQLYQALATVRIVEVEEPSFDAYGEDEPPEDFWQEGPEYEQQQQPF
jgi:hypothetical protein